MERIARVFESYVPSENETQTEEGLVKPVLRVLEHDFEAQPALATPDGTKHPDYVFYRDAALHKKSGLDTRSGRLSMNKLPTLVDTCNLCARPRDAASLDVNKNRTLNEDVGERTRRR